jgi:NYN domain
LDRCALFVDASYALADGALAVHGTRNRDSVSWDYAGLLKLFGSLSRDRTGLPLLRCYWYDTVADGDRAAEHDTLADIPGVKLRLSKARPSRKEGVEAEIRKDLTALARNHAVTDVIIVSAEEDLGPVIAEVQDLGIRTILLHVATDGNWARSRSLRQECDDIIEIAPGHLRPYVDLIAGAEPQLANAGYRELAASTTQSGGPQHAIDAPAVRLYGSPAMAEYQLAGPGNGQGQGQDQRDLARAQDASRFGGQVPGGQVAGGQGEVLNSGPIQRGADNQQTSAQDQQLQTAGLAQAQNAQAQNQNVQAQPAQSAPPIVQPPMAQPAMAQPAMAQLPMAQPPQAQPGQTQQYQHQDVGRAQAAASSETAFGHAGFTGQDPARGQNGQFSHHQESGFGQRSAGDDGRGQPGSLPGVAGAGQPVVPGQNGAGQNGLGQYGMGQNGMGQPGPGQNSLAPNGQAGAPGPMSTAPGGGQPGGGLHSGGQFGGFAPQGGVTQQGGISQQGGTGPHGVGQHGGPVPGNGLAPGALQSQGRPAHGMATGQPGSLPGQGADIQGNGLHASGMQPGGLPPAGIAHGGTPGSHGGGLPSNGAANGLAGGGHGGLPMGGGQQPNGGHLQPGGQQPGMPMQGGQQGPQPAQGHGLAGQGQGQGQSLQGQPLQGQPLQGQPLQGQPLQGQPLQGQPLQGPPAPGQQGLQRPGAPVMAPNGMMPLEAQRPQRQLPAGNTGPYSQDRSMPYSGQMQPAQFSGPAGSTPYPPSAYGGQPPAAPPPVAMSVGDAVQSAHAEGFGFGEAVARDAPALWLEAVLARKPRMPSDLEARLLQGSALPIDSLLHDEVRHALRRGFWDALERSRH